MNYDTIVVSKRKDKVVVTLNRPEVHNAMNEQLMTELTEAFKRLSKDNTVRIIVLTANGKSFCSGADLNWMKSMVNFSKEENIRDSQLVFDLLDTIYNCPRPVIGRINGHAFGGGVGLIAVCDITISIPGLKFAFSEANLGIIPSVISSFVSTRVNISNMRRLFITAERFESQFAHDIGLIDYIVLPNEIDKKVDYYIEQVKSSGPIAIKEIKELMKKFSHMHINDYKKYTIEKISELRVSEEGQEGINAFLNKRKPNWRE
jgi:methylglutaconyl-CoA hydratase